MLFLKKDKKYNIFENKLIGGKPIKLDEIKQIEDEIDKNIDKDIDIGSDVINSLRIKDTLNQDIWPKGRISNGIRNKMLEISEDFIEGLKLPENVEIKDIIFTGSLTNYNWSEYSDIDLHIIIDFNKLDMDEEMLKEYFQAKKMIWNNKHDIKISDFPVEMYVQDVNEEFHGESIYSVLKNKWNKKPIKEKFIIDKNKIKEKAKKYIDLLKDIRKNYNQGKYEEVIKEVDKIKSKVKKMRLSGLESGGEYSIENFVFKVLRRSSFMEVLNSYKIKAYDNKMSVE